MDKFTVDLDQVLNDFEYSELTDQYNNSPKLSDNNPVVAQSHNVSKHSINNVFHSLNEYLNTNINVNSLVPVGNVNSDSEGHYSNSNEKEVSINEENKADSDFISISQLPVENPKEEYNPLVEDNELIKVEEISNIDSFHSYNSLNNEGLKIAEHFETNSNFESTEDTLENAILKFENNVDLHTELQNVVGDNFGIGSDKKLHIDGQELKTVGFDQALHFDDQEINKLLSELEEDDEINIEANESQLCTNKGGCETVGNENITYDTGIELSGTEVKSGNKISKNEIENTDNIKTDNNKGELDYINLINSKKAQDKEIIDSDCFKESSHSLEDLNHIEGSAVEPKNICQIENQNNHKHLEGELLNLIDSKELSNASQVICVQNNESTPTPFEPNSAIDDMEVILKERLSQLNSQSSLEKTSNVEESHSKEILSSDLESNISVEHKIDEENIIFNENQLDMSSQKPFAENIENIAGNSETSNELEEITVVETEKVLVHDEKENAKKSKSRPHDLPLTTEILDSERKINLIGDPGSTPYNNIYFNNEIEKQQNNDNPNCSSSSSTSPTLSDASSTASTASTEDIQYKQDLSESTDINNTNQPENNSNEDVSVAQNVIPDSATEEHNDVEEDVPDQEVSQATTDIVGEQSQRVHLGEEPSVSNERCWLGKEAPLWIPDSEAISCLHCDMKFTMLKRRHHCRACGLVLCSKCCHLRFRLEYLDAEARVCNSCHDILNKESSSNSSSDISPEGGSSPSHRPNPNNPLEYCSTISPLQQVGSSHQNPPSVMVPVGVLKRKGSNKAKSSKSVMFCDGIRPGSDLTNLDNDFNYNNTFTKKLEKTTTSAGKINRNLPLIDSETNTFIPKNENSLPPTVAVNKSDIKYTECSNNISTVNILKDSQLTFAIHISLHVNVKIINMDCCVNKVAWCFSTEGLINVGQDEVVILLEYLEGESTVPKDIFYHINTVYNDAVKGNSIKEMGLSLQNSPNFLDSKNHAGFIYIRPTFQCLENVIKPKDPFLIGILIHRWETPWAKLFPLRLILRLGAEYRYYPSPVISTRHRDSVYVEIGHTIINILADFRNFSYSLPQIRGLTIHMEEKITTVNIPVNRYDQVLKSLNNSSDHILAFAGNFSVQADSHLVCIQDTQGNENCYSTHAINIHNKPRKITGASFIVFNGALKTSSGLTAKSNIIEDGLMIQVLPEQLKQIRESLRAMKNYNISCGCVDDVSDESVQIVWSDNDTNFNVGVISTIDGMSLGGIPSIRVHNGKNYICHNGSRIIRWTEVFIIQNGEDNPKGQDPVDISRVSESIAKATCDALVKYLDLLIANNFQKIGIRVNLHVDNVSYCAGSNATKLPPIYMKSLDNELIPVLHRITSNNFGENTIILELIFRILNV